MTRSVSIVSLLAIGLSLQAASWTPLNKLPARLVGPMILLTDGTVLAVAAGGQTWYRLAPDATGSYITGSWTQYPSSTMLTPRFSYASQVLPNGKLWVMGGEDSGTGMPQNQGYFAELFDPVTSTWSAAAPFPNYTACPVLPQGAQVAGGTPVMTNIGSTSGWQPGWVVSSDAGQSTSIPAGTKILSVDSPTSIHLTANATGSGAMLFHVQVPLTGNTTAGSALVTGIASTAGINPGFTVSGSGIPSGVTVASVSGSSITLSAPATATKSGVALTLFVVSLSCFGDLESMVIPGPKILTPVFKDPGTRLYDPVADSWSVGPSKVYSAEHWNEEGWVRMGDGSVLVYDSFQSEAQGAGFAEKYDLVANKWIPISPGDGTAKGTLPILTTAATGNEMGPMVRLFDDRIFAVGANGHTALYTPSTNTWAAGPDMIGTLAGQPFLYSADDAPAAVLPNGHVLFMGDAGNGIATSGNTVSGSAVVMGIPSTAQLQVGRSASGNGIPSNATILSVDSPTQVTLTANATATASGVAIQFGGLFDPPSAMFDFDPSTNSISPVSPAYPGLLSLRAQDYYMLMLPTGNVLVGNNQNQLYLYTTDKPATPLTPTVSSIVSKGGGTFTLGGTQLTGQSAGTAFGDELQSDSNYPIVRFLNATGNTYYATTSNWSYIGVGGGSTPQTVDFTLNPQIPAGNYSLYVSGAGLQSNPVAVKISPDLGTITMTPSISAVTDVASTRTSAVQGQFIAIYGQGLATTTRAWSGADFTGGTSPGSPLPTSLDGVSVTVGGVAAAVYFVSPTQLDVQVPAGVPVGSAKVIVTVNSLASSAANINIVAAAPSFYTYASGTNIFPAAVHLDGTLIGDPQVAGSPAHPGEIVEFFLSGLASAPAGVVAGTTTFTPTVSVTAGGAPLTVLGTALVAVGEYQVNAQVPASLAAGTYPLVLSVPGGTTSSNGVNVVLPVAAP